MALNVWLVRRNSQSDCETGEFRFHSPFLQMGTDALAASWWDKSQAHFRSEALLQILPSIYQHYSPNMICKCFELVCS